MARALLGLAALCWRPADSICGPLCDLPAGRTQGAPRKLMECAPANLTARGREMVKHREAIVFRMQTFTGTPMCIGRRVDWRESLPQCLGAMTGLDVFVVHGHNGVCTECSTLSTVDCAEVAKRDVAVGVVVGGGNSAYFRCGGVVLGGRDKMTKANVTYALRATAGGAICTLDEDLTLDGFHGVVPYLKQMNFGPRTVKLWLPMVQNSDPSWGVWERGRIFSAGGGSEWHVLNDYHLPKMPSPPSSWGAKIPMADRLELHPIADERDLLLYIARLDRGKGQADFLNNVAEELAAYDSKTFRFFLEYSLDANDTNRPLDRRMEAGRLVDAIAAARSAGASDAMLDFYESRVPARSVKHNLTAARGLLHLATIDRNPRVIYEALDHGLPVMTSVQSMGYRGLECAPPSVAVVVDAFDEPPALARDFGRFLAGTRDVATKKQVARFADALRPQRVYPCLCAAVGLCDAPRDPRYHENFYETLTTGNAGQGVKVPRGCALGKHLEGVRCAKSDFFSCVRWGTWFEGAAVAQGNWAARYFAVTLFRRTNLTVALFGRHFEDFSRLSCYNDTLLRAFADVALVRPFWATRGQRSRGRRAIHGAHASPFARPA